MCELLLNEIFHFSVISLHVVWSFIWLKWIPFTQWCCVSVFKIKNINSPEVTAQVSFSNLVVRLSLNFSYFHLLLQNHWVNFNQSWHKASLGKENSSLHLGKYQNALRRIDGQTIFQREIMTKQWTNLDLQDHWTNYKTAVGFNFVKTVASAGQQI